MNASKLSLFDKLITDCVVEFCAGGGPGQMDARRRERFVNFAKLILTLSIPGEDVWQLNLENWSVVQGVCILTAELLQAEDLLEVELHFAGAPPTPDCAQCFAVQWLRLWVFSSVAESRLAASLCCA